MNCKLNKIFTKCCASILAVSNIFSGVSATPKKAEDNQLSISTNEFLVSILLASGFATLATLPLSKKIFSAKSTPTEFTPASFNGSETGGYGFFNPADTTEDIEAVESMALALAKTDEKSKAITGERLLQLCGAKSCKELLNLKKISVDLNGNKYVYRVSGPGNPSSTKPDKEGGLLSKLKYCLFSSNNSLKKLGWEKTLPFVINIVTFDSNSYLNARKKSTAVSVTVGRENAIESITKHTYSIWRSSEISIDITREDELKEGFYPNESINTAVMNVGYWEKISGSRDGAASSSSRGFKKSEEEVVGNSNFGLDLFG